MPFHSAFRGMKEAAEKSVRSPPKVPKKPPARKNPYSMFKMPWGSPFDDYSMPPKSSGPKYKPTARPKPAKPAKEKAPIGRAMGPIAAKMKSAVAGRAAPKPKGKKCTCHDKKPKSTSSSAPSSKYNF